MTDTEQVETPVPDANVSPEIDAEADAEAKTTGNEAESSPAAKETGESPEIKKVQSRFDELTRHRREAERRAEERERERDYWREQALRAQPKSEPEPKAPQPPKTLADFEYDEAKYQAHLFEQAEARAAAAAERKLREYQERDTQTRRQSEFAAREREFAKSTADYYEVTRSQSLRITQSMVDAAAESEEAAAVLYYLGKNPEVTDRIASLSPLAAAREIGRIEAKLIAEREKVKAPVVSKAPPPTPKLEALEPAVETDPDKLGDEEWMKWREKQLARKRK